MSFSFHRFILLLKMQFAVNRRFYLLGTLATAGLLLVYMFFRAANANFGFEFDMQEENYELSLVFLSVTFGTMIFRQLGSRSRRVQSFMLPVSALERMSVASVLVLIVFPLAYTLIYLLCGALVNLADVYVLDHPNELYLLNGGNEPKMLMIMYMMLPAVLLCAVWFRKLTFVKTLAALCMFLLVFSFFNSLLGKVVVNSVDPPNPQGWKYFFWGSMPFESLTVVPQVQNRTFNQLSYNVYLPSGQQLVFTVFICCIPLFFLYLTYLKLREQEL